MSFHGQCPYKKTETATPMRSPEIRLVTAHPPVHAPGSDLRFCAKTPPKARLDDVLEQESDRFAALFPWDRHTELVLLPDRIELDDLGLSGFARTAAEQLAEREGDPVAAAALALLYRLAGAGNNGGDGS